MEENFLIVDKYYINYHTLAVLPSIVANGDIYSKVYEHNNVFLCKLSPLMIVKATCGYLGSSYEGRREGTRQLMTYYHKLPIVIDDFNSVYFFPLILLGITTVHGFLFIIFLIPKNRSL
ncbi:competence protein ComK [Niallia circulans]